MSKETGTPPLIKVLSPLKEKLDFTYIAIIVLSIALYVGFDDLIAGAASGTARDTISAALAAIFVLITTMYMLNKQSDIEQDKKYKAEIFKKKFQLYDNLITNWLNIAYIDKCIKKENYKECLDNHYEILMIADGNAVEHSNKILGIVSSYYNNNKQKLDDDDLYEIKKIIKEFTHIVRDELSISKLELNPEDDDQKETNEKIMTGKKLVKFEFNGKKYFKRGLVLAIVKYAVEEKGIKTFKKLIEMFPDRDATGGNKSNKRFGFVVGLKKNFNNPGNEFRIYGRDGDIIELDEEIIVHNQWGGPDFDYFLEQVKKNLKYKIDEL